MMIDWGSLDSFDDWAKALDRLLDEANAAAYSKNVEQQVEAQKLLRKFRKESPNECCRKLDEIAGAAIEDLARAAVEDTVRGIAARSSELDDFVKDISSVTTRTDRAAKWLSLESEPASNEGGASPLNS